MRNNKLLFCECDCLLDNVGVVCCGSSSSFSFSFLDGVDLLETVSAGLGFRAVAKVFGGVLGEPFSVEETNLLALRGADLRGDDDKNMAAEVLV